MPRTVVAQYNVENLFDTIDNPKTRDEDFLPTGKLKWDSQKYKTKLEHMSQAIVAINGGAGPDILSLCEVENRAVVEDLVKQKALKKGKYQIIHTESGDMRGIDVALIYKKAVFKSVSFKAESIDQHSDSALHSRPILFVSGNTPTGQRIHILVNHWPSRLAGKEISEAKRMAASNTARHIIDSLEKADPNSGIICLGDFNDEPTDSSIKNLMGTGANQLINPLAALESQGKGTHNYKNHWSTLDQILYSPNMKTVTGANAITADVLMADFLLETDPKYKGNPLRTYVGNKYLGGYADHLPVFMIIQ